MVASPGHRRRAAKKVAWEEAKKAKKGAKLHPTTGSRVHDGTYRLCGSSLVQPAGAEVDPERDERYERLREATREAWSSLFTIPLLTDAEAVERRANKAPRARTWFVGGGCFTLLIVGTVVVSWYVFIGTIIAAYAVAFVALRLFVALVLSLSLGAERVFSFRRGGTR
ncbi:MAG: hypothetical protein ACYDHU_09500 [Acidimicrobiales bacterium]